MALREGKIHTNERILHCAMMAGGYYCAECTDLHKEACDGDVDFANGWNPHCFMLPEAYSCDGDESDLICAGCNKELVTCDHWHGNQIQMMAAEWWPELVRAIATETLPGDCVCPGWGEATSGAAIQPDRWGEQVRYPLFHLIIHLNDQHHYTFSQVADWLDTLNLNGEGVTG